MLWKPIGIEDSQMISERLKKAAYPLSDYNFTHMMLWQEAFKLEYLIYKDFLLIRGDDFLDGKPFIYMPIGSGDLASLLSELLALEEAPQYVLKAISPDMNALLSSHFKAHYLYRMDRNEAEYNYRLEKLSHYNTSELRRKREQCQSFEKKYSYRFEPYIPANDYRTLYQFLWDWYEAFNDQGPMVLAERAGILNIIHHYMKLPCVGYCLWVDEKLIGFILAEALNDDILVVHFEKGNRNYKGVYDMMKRELAKTYMNQYTYLSLEEDMGIEGLRQAKSLYCPDLMQQKGSILCQSIRR